MKRKVHIILLVLLLLCVLSTTAFAIDESEVESAIAASSKEEVAGNVFIWFLCAIGFLKVSQKIDSFMASLGINVGRTGGSMLTELMVAGRGIAAVAGAVGGTVFNHHSSSNSTHTNAQAAGAAFTGGGNGLVGVTRRAAGNAAAASATGNAKGLSNLVGGAMFESSLQNGGKFAMSVVGAVAKGSISSVGSITGDQAAEALTSYLGYSPVDSGSALADDGGLIPPSPITSEDVVTLDGGTAAGTASPSASANGTPIPSGAREHDGSVVESARISGAPPIFQNVEIGGGRITGLEVSPDRQSDSHEHANQYTGELLPPSPASAPYAIFRQSSETVRTSVIIGLGSKLAVLQAQQVRNITSYNEIDLELPGKQKCAYFCIVSDQDSTYDFLSSLFFSFLFIRLIRYADAYCESGMLHPKVKFILDEFPNCCLIPDFTKKCSTIRSRGCSVAVFFQNVGQMRNRYPDDQWQEILGACDSTVFLGCTDMLTAEYFSDRIGTASVEVEGTMRELNTMHITDYTPRFRKTNSLGRRPLLTPDEVLRLPPDQVLIFIRGQKVMRAKRFDYSLHPDYKKLKSRKAILHEPDWKSSQASSVSASGVSSPSVTAAIPAEKANVGSQKKPPGKPARSTTRKVVNADELF